MLVFLIALAGGSSTYLLWNGLVRKRRGEALTVAERRLERFAQQSGLDEDVDMTTSSATAKPPSLIDRTAAALVRQGVFGLLDEGDALQWINRRVVLAGNPRGWNGAEFISFYTLLVISAIGFSFLLIAGGTAPPLIIAGLLIVVVLYPFAWLNRLVKTRQGKAFAELPDFLDDLVLSLSSGMSVLDDALERILRDTQEEQLISGRQNILVNEFGRAYREYRYGHRDRDTAFEEAAERIGLPEVDNLVQAIAEAYRTGSPILEALQNTSEHIYAIYEQRMKEYIERRSLSFVISLALIMCGVLVIIAAPIFAQLISAFSGGGGG